MSYDPTDRRGQAEEKERQRREQQRDAEQLAADVRWLMADPRGRRLMRRWLAFCGVNRTSFDGTSRTYFTEGGRNVGLMLQAQATEHALESYLTMLREMQEQPKA